MRKKAKQPRMVTVTIRNGELQISPDGSFVMLPERSGTLKWPAGTILALEPFVNRYMHNRPIHDQISALIRAKNELDGIINGLNAKLTVGQNTIPIPKLPKKLASDYGLRINDNRIEVGCQTFYYDDAHKVIEAIKAVRRRAKK